METLLRLFCSLFLAVTPVWVCCNDGLWCNFTQWNCLKIENLTGCHEFFFQNSTNEEVTDYNNASTWDLKTEITCQTQTCRQTADPQHKTHLTVSHCRLWSLQLLVAKEKKYSSKTWQVSFLKTKPWAAAVNIGTHWQWREQKSVIVLSLSHIKNHENM